MPSSDMNIILMAMHSLQGHQYIFKNKITFGMFHFHKMFAAVSGTQPRPTSFMKFNPFAAAMMQLLPAWYSASRFHSVSAFRGAEGKID